MTVISFGKGAPDTIISGVDLPAARRACGRSRSSSSSPASSCRCSSSSAWSFLLISVQRGSSWPGRATHPLYRIIEALGRWSMVDVFVIAILVGAGGARATSPPSQPGPGAVAFCAVVVVTMLAAMAFDPRLIWDVADDETHDRAAAPASELPEAVVKKRRGISIVWLIPLVAA